jgi:MFS family permease
MMKFYQLPGEVFLTRLFSFVMIGGGGYLIAFLNLFYLRAGMSGAQIGVLAMLASFFSMAAAPFWGRWSDRSGRLKSVLQLSLVLSALAGLALGLQNGFGSFALFTILLAILSAGTIPLATALSMVVVTRYRLGGFGDIRRWGSLGWALLLPLGGLVFEATSLRAIFPLYALTMFAGAILLFSITITNSEASQSPIVEAAETTSRVRTGQALAAALRSRSLLALLLSTLVFGLLNAGWRNFHQVYQSQLGAGASLIAVASVMGAVVEVPAMPWVDRGVRRFGAARMLLAGMALDAVRLSLILAFPSVPVIFLANAVGGVVFSLKLVAPVAYVLEHTPPGMASTMLALLTGSFYFLIDILGGALSGLAYDAFGAYWLYAIGVAGNLLGMLIFYILARE